MSRNIKASFGIVLMAFAAACFFVFGVMKDELPEPAAWTDEPDYVLIQKGPDLLFFSMEEGRWFMGKEKSPADAEAVRNLTDRIRNLHLTENVSEEPVYESYGLDADHETVIIAKKGKNVLGRISFGIPDSSGTRTYVKISGRPGIFLAEGTLSGQELSPAAYRKQ